MKLSRATMEELRVILREDYGWDTTEAELEEAARSFVGYFDGLAMTNHQTKSKGGDSNE